MSADRKRYLSQCPRLAGFARIIFDSVREQWTLQAPERVLVLDDTSKEILDFCDGKTTAAQIVERLLEEYDAPAEMIENDVLAVLDLLCEKTLLEWVQDDGESRNASKK